MHCLPLALRGSAKAGGVYYPADGMHTTSRTGTEHGCNHDTNFIGGKFQGKYKARTVSHAARHPA
jgi:hypothetical protein